MSFRKINRGIKRSSPKSSGLLLPNPRDEARYKKAKQTASKNRQSRVAKAVATASTAEFQKAATEEVTDSMLPKTLLQYIGPYQFFTEWVDAMYVKAVEDKNEDRMRIFGTCSEEAAKQCMKYLTENYRKNGPDVPAAATDDSDECRLHPSTVTQYRMACSQMFAHLHPKSENIFLTDEIDNMLAKYKKWGDKCPHMQKPPQVDVTPEGVLKILLAAERVPSWKDDSSGVPNLEKVRFQAYTLMLARAGMRPNTLSYSTCEMLQAGVDPEPSINRKGELHHNTTLTLDLRGRKIAGVKTNSRYTFHDSEYYYFSVIKLLKMYWSVSGHTLHGYIFQQNSIGRPYLPDTTTST